MKILKYFYLLSSFLFLLLSFKLTFNLIFPLLVFSFTLAFTRNIDKILDWFLLLISFFISYYIFYKDVFNTLNNFYIILYLIIYLFNFLFPIMVDKIYRDLYKNSPLSSFIFPVAYTGVEFIISLFPLNYNYSISYSQFNNILFLQILSITGIWGLIFIISYLSTLISEILEFRYNLKTIHKKFLIIFITTIIIVSFGIFRLITNKNYQNIKLTIIDLNTNYNNINNFFNEFKNNNGLIFVKYENIGFQKNEISSILDYLTNYCKEYKNYLLFSCFIKNSDYKESIYFINSKGEIEYSYFDVFDNVNKIKFLDKKDIKVIETVYGKFCILSGFYQYNFNYIIDQVLDNKIDVVFVITYDSKNIINNKNFIKNYFKSIESGFNLFYFNMNGESYFSDPYGKYVKLDGNENNKILMIRKTQTFYRYIKDSFGNICFLIMALIIFSIIKDYYSIKKQLEENKKL